jgi:mannose-6-phosphate isomerase-like protein (cupin superfamily)
MRNIDIRDNDIVYAQIYNLNIEGGIIFPTSSKSEMQCGFGTIFEKTSKKPHIHKILERNTQHTSEFFFIYEGSVTVTFYNKNEEVIAKEILKAGMGFTQFFGGHGFVFAPNTKYIEIKQGPYIGSDDDKYFFEPYEERV